MVRRLALADAQKDLPRLIHELAEAGDSVEIEEGGRVVATLTVETNGHTSRSHDDPLFTAFADFDEELLDRFHQYVREIHETPPRAPIGLDRLIPSSTE